MASFNLNKGEKFSIQKGLNKVTVGVGWDAGTGQTIDVDVHAFGCLSNGGSPKFFNDGSHAVTYANGDLLKNGKSFGSRDGSIVSTGDCRTGDTSQGGDDEAIEIDFSKLPAEIDDICIFATIYEAKSKRQNFGLINSCYVRVFNTETGEELCRYNMTKEFSSESAQIGSLIKKGGAWSFEAVGAGFDEDLGAILAKLS